MRSTRTGAMFSRCPPIRTRRNDSISWSKTSPSCPSGSIVSCRSNPYLSPPAEKGPDTISTKCIRPDYWYAALACAIADASINPLWVSVPSQNPLSSLPSLQDHLGLCRRSTACWFDQGVGEIMSAQIRAEARYRAHRLLARRQYSVYGFLRHQPDSFCPS